MKLGEIDWGGASCIDGNGPNDIFCACRSSSIIHYNGHNWEQISPYYPDTWMWFRSITVSNDVVWALARTVNEWIVIRGVRE